VCLSASRIIDGETFTSSITITKHNSDENLIKIFCLLLAKNTNYILSGFNINSFDIPVITKKAIKYGISIPKQLNIWKWKPWEKPVFDIFDFWKVGSSGWPSLETVSGFLDCGNPKDVMHGNEVKEYYYVEDDDLHLNNIKKIQKYCEGDVISCVNIFQKIYKLEIVIP
jgi:DNA polymerase elongation subunit (family B)